MKRAWFILLPALVLACSKNEATTADSNAYTELDLVSDNTDLAAASHDANLVNPWGLAFGATGILWVANNHTGTSTLYDANGVKQSTVVTIPSPGSTTIGGAPTGVIYNGTADFVIPGSTTAQFIYAGEDGIISAWASGTSAVTVADRSGVAAVYKGIAMASNGGANFLYATNFKQGHVDVFDKNFHFVSSFTDATVIAGYAPFGIRNIGGLLYVTFAKQLGPDNEDDDPGIGHGYVDIFNPDGTMAGRLAEGGNLNSPWAVVMAPAGFGDLGGDILVGNFGDGYILAYNPATHAYVDAVKGSDGNAITIFGLWDLQFGPTTNSTTLYFSAGPSDESHGLLGELVPK